MITTVVAMKQYRWKNCSYCPKVKVLASKTDRRTKTSAYIDPYIPTHLDQGGGKEEAEEEDKFNHSRICHT